MKYWDGVQALIGNTPLVKLNRVGAPDEVGLFAKLELWNPGGSVKDRIGVSMVEDAEKRGELRPGAGSLKQFENPANPRTHYEATGPEIWRDLDGRVGYLVAGAGSGGTYSGTMKYLKELNERVKGGNIMALFPDRGDRYFSQGLYNCIMDRIE